MQILSSTRGSLLTDPARNLELVSTNDPLLASQPAPDLEVFNGTGASVGTYAPEGAGQMALSADGDLLYVASVLQPTIKRFDLTQDPFGELSDLALTQINFPQSLVVAGGALWVADCLPAGTVEKVDPSTGHETVQDLSTMDAAIAPISPTTRRRPTSSTPGLGVTERCTGSTSRPALSPRRRAGPPLRGAGSWTLPSHPEVPPSWLPSLVGMAQELSR
jgi:hypothetical protein